MTPRSLPLTTIITPSTRSVASAARTISEMMPVPNIEYDSVYFNSTVTLNPLLQRLVSSSASGMAVLRFPAPSPNSSYVTLFYGPSLECDDVGPTPDKDS